MTAASLAKAGAGFCGRADFFGRRGLGFDFLRGREAFFGGMRAFFPEGLTVGRVVVFYKPERTKRRERIYHRGRNEVSRGRGKEQPKSKGPSQLTLNRGALRSSGQACAIREGEAGWWGRSFPVINWCGWFAEDE